MSTTTGSFTTVTSPMHHDEVAERTFLFFSNSIANSETPSSSNFMTAAIYVNHVKVDLGLASMVLGEDSEKVREAMYEDDLFRRNVIKRLAIMIENI